MSCHNFSFVSIWIFEFCQNLNFWVLSQFEFLSFDLVWVDFFFVLFLSFVRKKYNKHCDNHKTLPREHPFSCQGVRMFLLKDGFKFAQVHTLTHTFEILSFVTIWVLDLSQFQFFSFIKICVFELSYFKFVSFVTICIVTI